VQGILLNVELAWKMHIKNLCYVVQPAAC